MEKAKLNQLFEEVINSLGYLLIDIVVRGDNHLRIFELYIDNEKGITTDDCVLVSRAINEKIEEEKIIDSNYRLDVSSPGIDRPLKFLVQYQKHLNRKFEVQYKVDDQVKKLTGKLLRIEADNLFFSEKNDEVKINFNNIIKAKVLISF
jgi:ribosome maturation factor RimP